MSSRSESGYVSGYVSLVTRRAIRTLMLALRASHAISVCLVSLQLKRGGSRGSPDPTPFFGTFFLRKYLFINSYIVSCAAHFVSGYETEFVSFSEHFLDSRERNA